MTRRGFQPAEPFLHLFVFVEDQAMAFAVGEGGSNRGEAVKTGQPYLIPLQRSMSRHNVCRI